MEAILEILNGIVAGVGDLASVVLALPEEVYIPALGIFIFVGLLKALNVVGENEQAAAANIVLSLAANYGNLGEENAALVFGATAVGAAAFYKLWSRGVLPLWAFLKGKFVKV